MRVSRMWFTVLAGLAAAGVQAADFPARPVTMVVPFTAGGPTDLVGRLISAPMSKVLKQHILIDNAAGAGGTIGAGKVAKAKVTMANAGLGAASHLCGLLFQSGIGTDLATVAYKGTAPAMTDLLGGHVDLLCDQTTNTTAQIQADKVQVYAVTSKARVASLPNVPTAGDSGLPGFEVAIWHGLYLPKGTPKPVVDLYVAALKEALKDANVKAKFAELGAELATDARASPSGLQSHLKAELERWTPLIRKAGVYAD